MLNTQSPAFDTANAQAEIWPVRLFAIGGNPNLYYTDADVDVYWNGQVWLSKGITYNLVKSSLGVQTDTYKVSLDNIDDSMIAWAMTHRPTGFVTKVYTARTDGSRDASARLLLIDNKAVLLFSGINTACSAGDEFELSITSNLDLQQQRAPRSTQDITCRFKGKNGFKGPNCGYTGPQTTCNYTFATCTSYGNQERFGGFPNLNENTST